MWHDNCDRCSVARFMDLSTICGFLDKKNVYEYLWMSMDVYGILFCLDFLREQPGNTVSVGGKGGIAPSHSTIYFGSF